MATFNIPLPGPNTLRDTVIPGLQLIADNRYADDLKIYNAAASDWITAQTGNRDAGLEVTPFTKAVPKRTVFYLDEKGAIASKDAPVDPAIKPPVLPPPVTKNTAPASTPFVTGAVADGQKLDTIFAVIMDFYPKFIRLYNAQFPEGN